METRVPYGPDRIETVDALLKDRREAGVRAFTEKAGAFRLYDRMPRPAKAEGPTMPGKRPVKTKPMAARLQAI